MPSAEQMQVEVVDGLSAVRAGVENDAIAAVKLCGAGDFGGLSKQMAQQRRLRRLCLCQRGDVFLGNNQQVGRCLGVKVGEAEA